MQPQFGDHVCGRHVFAEGHQVPLVVAADEVFLGVDQQRRLKDLAGLLGIAAVDRATEQERAWRIGEWTQALERRPRPAVDDSLVGERLESCFVGAAAALGPADEVDRAVGRTRVGLPAQPPELVDGAILLGIDLHDRQSHGRRGGRQPGPGVDGPGSVGEVGDADRHRRDARRRNPPQSTATDDPPAQDPIKQHHDRAGVRKQREGRRLGTEQVGSLHRDRPGGLGVADFPGEDGGHEGLRRDRDQGGRQPGRPRITNHPPNHPEGKGDAAGVPEHDRHGEGDARLPGGPHRIGQHRRRPMEGGGEGEHGGDQHECFVPPATPAGAQHQRRGDTQPAGRHELLIEPWRRQKDRHAQGGDQAGRQARDRHSRWRHRIGFLVR